MRFYVSTALDELKKTKKNKQQFYRLIFSCVYFKILQKETMHLADVRAILLAVPLTPHSHLEI